MNNNNGNCVAGILIWIFIVFTFGGATIQGCTSNNDGIWRIWDSVLLGTIISGFVCLIISCFFGSQFGSGDDAP